MLCWMPLRGIIIAITNANALQTRRLQRNDMAVTIVTLHHIDVANAILDAFTDIATVWLKKCSRCHYHCGIIRPL